MPSFFMAITITSVRPPTVKAPIAWDWQAAQDDNPHAEVPLTTLASTLKTGTVGVAGTTDAAPKYTVTGVRGLIAAGGAAANGDLTKDAPPAPAAASGGTP